MRQPRPVPAPGRRRVVRLSRSLFATQRERPAGSLTRPEELLARGGFVHEIAPGTYVRTPPLRRTLARIAAVLVEELAGLGCEEVDAPVALPAGSGAGRFGDAALTVQERKGTSLRLATSLAEPVAAYMDARLASYRQLPARVLVSGTVFRTPASESRFHVGARETDVVEVVGFDADGVQGEATLAALRAAVTAALRRCSVATLAARAAPAGDDRLAETCLVAPLAEGDLTVATTSETGDAAMPDVARARIASPADPPGEAPMRRVETPGARTIDGLREALPGVPPARMLKTMLYRTAAGDVVAALCRGDRQVDERKLARHVGGADIELADDMTIRELTGAEPGFSGPVGLPSSVRVVADHSVADLRGFACGANATDAHLVDVWFGRDLPLPEVADIDAVQDGDESADGSGRMRLVRGLGLGRLGPLPGTRATYADRDGRQREACVSWLRLDLLRVALACVGQHSDGSTLRWPLTIAPHAVTVVQARADDEQQTALAQDLATRLGAAGVDVVWDDRDARIGVKFNDAELAGAPVTVVVGRDAADGRVELRLPGQDGREVVPAGDAVATITGLVDGARVPGLP